MPLPATRTHHKATIEVQAVGVAAATVVVVEDLVAVEDDVAAVAEEAVGNGPSIRRSRCVTMIPKRSNLLQHYCERPLAATSFQQYLYNRGDLQSHLEHGARDLVPIKLCTPTP